MDEIDSTKNNLVDDLWLPIMQIAGSILYPRLRTNKKMKILTLTNDRNHEEIGKIIENKIAEKKHIVAWTHSFQKKLRLETDTGCTVEGCSKYDGSKGITVPLQSYFPFDGLNLDFSSQDPYSENGRMEDEIRSVEKTIQFQSEKQQSKNGFVLIYTTLLNSYRIDKERILKNSNGMQVQGWVGLQLNDFQTTIAKQEQKMNFIERVLEQIFSKYSYSIYEKNKKHYSIQNAQKVIFSIALIVRK